MYLSFTWSPCGFLFAVVAAESVEIWDALSLKLLFSLHPTKAATKFRHGLAYSMDGYSLAACSHTGIVIWDTQTGGEVGKINCEVPRDGLELAWSSDGKAICTVSHNTSDTATVQIYDTTSGVVLFLDTMQTKYKLYFWKHDKSFRIATIAGGYKGWTFEIFEVQPCLTKIESFSFRFNPPFGAFSPATYRVSVTASDYKRGTELLVFGLQNSEVLLRIKGSYVYQAFSPDASLFAATTRDHILIFQYSSGCYTQWREFKQSLRQIQFSPTLSSILACSGVLLHVLNLDHSTTTKTTETTVTAHNKLLDAFSPDGTFIATGYCGGNTITLTNLNCQHPFPAQFIDTDLEISEIVLTGNVLLVKGSDKIVAWLLTEKGVVDGIVGNTRADHNDSLWEVSLSQRVPRTLQGSSSSGGHLEFSVGSEVAGIRMHGYTICAYDIRTGGALKPAEASKHLGRSSYQFDSQYENGCNEYHHSLCKQKGLPNCEWKISQASLQEGWVRDPEGNHRLWLQPNWRLAGSHINWLNNATTLRIRSSEELLIVKF